MPAAFWIPPPAVALPSAWLNRTTVRTSVVVPLLEIPPPRFPTPRRFQP
jgi:hypothetical protein